MNAKETTFRIPKSELVKVPSGLTVEDYIRFAINIHCNNLGLRGHMVTEMTDIIDGGDAYIVGFKSFLWEDVKEDLQFQKRLEEAMEEDITQSLDKMIGGNIHEN